LKECVKGVPSTTRVQDATRVYQWWKVEDSAEVEDSAGRLGTAQSGIDPIARWHGPSICKHSNVLVLS
jgi:hypothetical protein